MKMLLLLLPLVATVKPAPALGALLLSTRVPVVVELFTPEGRSSCPAADAALRELTQVQSVPGVEVIALGEHVDYRNCLGWKDDFLSSAYTTRRRQYATGFGSYTPQAVVNGRDEFVGSRTAERAATVAKVAKAPPAALLVTATGSTVQGQVRSLPPGMPATEVLLAITESGLAAQIGRGENAGLLLHHAAVVRQLLPLGQVRAAGTFTVTQPRTLAPGWKRPNLRVVALVQEIAPRRIMGAAAMSNGS